MTLSVRETKLVSTYDPLNAPDPVEVVTDFQRVREYVSKHPNHGRRRASNNLGLNEHRIRGWMEEASKPDVVRGLEEAQQRRWLTIDDDDPQQPALAILVSGAFSCGGIAENWVPAWTPSTDDGTALVTDALDELTGGHTVRHEDEENRPVEILPKESASVFGRVLVAYGAPQGDKNERSVSGLPDWLLDAPIATRRPAVELFILERGTFFESKDTVQIQCQHRSSLYRTDLARLIQSVADATVTANQNVVISAEAVRNLGFERDRSAVEG